MPTIPTPDAKHYQLESDADATMHVRTARGGIALMISLGFKLALLFVVQIVLARLLTPEDFGLVALVTSVITFFSLFNDLGLPMATVQRRDLNHEQVNLLFWINTIWGVGLALFTAATAQLFARLYGEPRVVSIMLVLSTGFLFIGLGSQHRALLKRRLQFSRLAIVDFVSVLAGAVVAIALARLGFRYWALVYMRLTTLALATLGLLLACGWRPSRPKLAGQIRPLLAFGIHLTSFDVMAYLIRNADNLLIGWYNGARALGFYSKAYQMLLVTTQQFNMPLGGVVIPALSRLQTEPGRYGAYYHRGILLSAAVGMPLVAFLFVGADWIVPLLLGAQWQPSIALFRALALAAFVGPLEVGSGWLVVSLGRTRRQFKWNVMSTALTLVGFIIGIRWGSVGVALSFSLCRVVLLIPKLIYSAYGSPISWLEMIKTASRPALASLFSAAGLFGISSYFAFLPHGSMRLVVSFCLFGLMYIGVWLALPGGRQSLLQLFRLVRYLWRQE